MKNFAVVYFPKIHELPHIWEDDDLWSDEDREDLDYKRGKTNLVNPINLTMFVYGKKNYKRLSKAR